LNLPWVNQNIAPELINHGGSAIPDASIDRNRGRRRSKLIKLVPKILQLQAKNLEWRLQIKPNYMKLKAKTDRNIEALIENKP